MSDYKNKFFASPALALALAFIVPIFFVFSQNSHMVTPDVMLASSGTIFLLACAILVTTSLAVRFWIKISANLPQWARSLVAIGFCLLLVETCCFFLQTPLHAMIPDPRWLRIIVSRIFPCMALLLLLRKLGFYPVNVFLTLFLGCSVVNLGVALLAEKKLSPPPPPPLSESSLATYKVKTRPNIYLFFLESYHSLDIQRNVYGIDTGELESWLANNGFVDYGKIYSNSPNTLLSLADTFRLSSSRVYARGNADVAADIRRMFGGSGENTLFRAFKENGYTTIFLVGDTSYYGIVREKFLDDSDSIDVLPAHDTMIHHILMYIRILNTRLYEEPFLSLTQSLAGLKEKSYKGSLKDRVSQAVTAHMRPAAPLFLISKADAALHTRSDGSYTWRQHADWVRSGKFQDSVKRNNRELRRTCDMIIVNDPGAMILLIGDHGAARFRSAEKGGTVESVGDFVSRVKEKGISFQDFCDDHYGVFLGIRLPYGQREDISYGLPMSHVNLFRHVFAWLNNDKSILATREPSNSYWGKDHAIIREGRPATGQ